MLGDYIPSAQVYPGLMANPPWKSQVMTAPPIASYCLFMNVT